MAKSFDLYGLETVWQSGPWSAQAEWMATVVNSSVGPICLQRRLRRSDVSLDRRTSRIRQKVERIEKPDPLHRLHFAQSGWNQRLGRWEIEARWSFVDIKNPASTQYLAGSNGAGNGFLTDTTLGMTWFLNAHTKLQFNWIHAMLQNTVKGPSLADLYVTRVQVDF